MYLYDSPKGYETTSLVKGINLKGDGNLSLFIEYEYDERGNIIRQGNTVYHYDAQNRISRCDDPQVKRFISSDDDTIAMSFDFYADPFQFNTFAYCNDNPIMYVDPEGYFSLSNAIATVNGIINRIASLFINYISNLIVYKNKVFKLNTVIVSSVIDAAVSFILRGFIYNGIKSGMRMLLRVPSIRKTFVGSMFNFFLNNGAGKAILWSIARVGFFLAGMKSPMGTFVEGMVKDFLISIAVSKSKILQKASNYIFAFSSVGGIIALFVDLLDKKADNYLVLRF